MFRKLAALVGARTINIMYYSMEYSGKQIFKITNNMNECKCLVCILNIQIVLCSLLEYWRNCYSSGVVADYTTPHLQYLAALALLFSKAFSSSGILLGLFAQACRTRRWFYARHVRCRFKVVDEQWRKRECGQEK